MLSTGLRTVKSFKHPIERTSCYPIDKGDLLENHLDTQASFVASNINTQQTHETGVDFVNDSQTNPSESKPRIPRIDRDETRKAFQNHTMYKT